MWNASARQDSLGHAMKGRMRWELRGKLCLGGNESRTRSNKGPNVYAAPMHAAIGVEKESGQLEMRDLDISLESRNRSRQAMRGGTERAQT